ncbi:MAG: tRNA dihydrouridine(20/20a) synthase DusA, partial [Gammaproteobacteria bacterium]|nr:tRNA dihydrouridine(20/20a) synthase DusA [Gammaproteobacteria bacterium]
DRRLSVAPMMDWTDRHCRFFHRLLAPRALLYTEMIVADALLRGDAPRLLAFDASEHPVACQLGGSEPAKLAEAARMIEQAGYDEVNLNVGCPSDRVQSGRFGACLMREPQLVADCVAAMREAVSIPVTVKTRLGVDELDSEDYLAGFIEQIAGVGCEVVILHARKAWLAGLSPKQNREVPPLDYARAYRIKQRFPELTIVLNGGVRSVHAACEHLRHADGVMLGREAYEHPWQLVAFHDALLDTALATTREQVLEAMVEYAAREQACGTRVWSIARHTLGLYAGQPGARAWRRALSEACRDAAAPPEVLLAAQSALQPAGSGTGSLPRSASMLASR